MPRRWSLFSIIACMFLSVSATALAQQGCGCPPRIVKAVQALHGDVIITDATIPPGKVWMVHFTPTGSFIGDTDFHGVHTNVNADDLSVQNFTLSSPHINI